MSDEAFDALADAERRQLLVTMLDHNPVEAPREIDDGAERTIRKSHVHLPKLDAYGFVEWDRERGVVTRGDRFEELVPILEFLTDGEALCGDV